MFHFFCGSLCLFNCHFQLNFSIKVSCNTLKITIFNGLRNVGRIISKFKFIVSYGKYSHAFAVECINWKFTIAVHTLVLSWLENKSSDLITQSKLICTVQWMDFEFKETNVWEWTSAFVILFRAKIVKQFRSDFAWKIGLISILKISELII